MNELKSYTEYAVSTPTADFVIGFDFNYGEDAVNVTVDDVPATEAGYTVVYLNETTIRLSPSVPSGVVRLQRETDIDQSDHAYRAGAKFIAQTMDENFEQLRHSQQEVRDGFTKLQDDTYAIIDTLEEVAQSAQEAADDANAAAQVANDAAAQVADKVSQSEIDYIHENGAALPFDETVDYAEGAFTVKDGSLQQFVGGVWKKPTQTAGQIFDESGLSQQQVNYNGGSKWHSRVGGYKLNERVVLTNGDIVKSTLNGNANDPNVNMTGWIYDNIKAYKPDIIAENNKIIGNGVTNDSSEIQKVLTKTDLEFKNHVDISTLNNNYLVDETLVLQEPAMIKGDAAATYNRGDGKTGKIVIGSTLVALNLGNERQRGAAPYVLDPANKRTKNLADQWTVKNLAFIQKTGEPARSKTAIQHTAKTDGPDRGFLMREVSGTGLKHLLHITHQQQQTQLATVVVENCCASNNGLPFFAEGNTNGARFVGNQIEQNLNGAIHGTYTGPVYIADNMLEGQRDAINITIPQITGGRALLYAVRNYFEANSGDYCVNYQNNASTGWVETWGNWLQAYTSKDYVRISAGYPTVVNKDSQPVTFFGNGSGAVYGSDFLSYNGVSSYKVRDLTGLGGVVAIRNHSDFVKHNPECVQANNIQASADTVRTPYGTAHCIKNNASAIIPVGDVAIGEVCQVNLLASINPAVSGGSFVLQALNSNGSTVIAELGVSSMQSVGKYTLFTFAFKAQVAATGSIRVRFLSSIAATLPFSSIIVGASAKKLTEVSGDVGAFIVNPETPFLSLVQNDTTNVVVTHATTPLNLTADVGQVYNITDAAAVAGDFIQVAVTSGINVVKMVSGAVLENGLIRVLIIPSITTTGAVIGLKVRRTRVV